MSHSDTDDAMAAPAPAPAPTPVVDTMVEKVEKVEEPVQVDDGLPLLNGAIQSPDDERDHLVASIYPVVHDSIVLPKTLDLRPWLRDVRDQGKTSTCAAQTAACIKEYQELIDTKSAADFSVDFVYSHRVNAPAEGMYGRDVMDILYRLGCASLPWPLGADDANDPKVLESASQYRIAEYARVETIEHLKEALAFDGPCYISFPVYNYSTTLWKPNPGDIRQGGHAMTVVGYTKEGFIIRNSWGKKWGDNGYCIYSYNDWGSHWEIWTAVDRQGSRPPFQAPKKKWCLC